MESKTLLFPQASRSPGWSSGERGPAREMLSPLTSLRLRPPGATWAHLGGEPQPRTSALWHTRGRGPGCPGRLEALGLWSREGRAGTQRGWAARRGLKALWGACCGVLR